MLFGIERMAFNLHAILYFIESIRQSGPFWGTSAFPLENHIYFLKQTIYGPKSVVQQLFP